MKKMRKKVEANLGLDISDSEDSYAYLKSNRSSSSQQKKDCVFESNQSDSQRETVFAKVKRHLDQGGNL